MSGSCECVPGRLFSEGGSVLRKNVKRSGKGNREREPALHEA